MATPGQIIGANVRGERARRNWSQVQLGELLGQSQPVVSALERGARDITIDDLIACCRALEIDLAFLLRGLPAEDRRVLGV